MRKVKFETFRQETKERSSQLGLTFLQNPAGRRIRTRPRDPIEQDILLRLSLKRKEDALKSGKYEIIGARRWRVHG
jgi:hypothetical protein